MIHKTKVDDIELVEPDKESMELVKKALEINEQIVSQNGMLIQMLGNPRIIIGVEADRQT